jgi:DNA modification methylase
MLQHELIATGWYGSHKFYKSKDKSVLFAPKPKKSSLHPTTKPVSLLRKVILNSTQINDIIYDPFAGSGSLLIACEQTKRKCLLVEIDLEYCQTIINTYNKLAS